MNPKKCSVSGCNFPRVKKPGNNIFYFDKCAEHLTEAILSKKRAEAEKDKAGLEIMRQTKKKTGVERFYSSTAWYWCSKYVLLYYADEDLNVRCSTSPHLIYRVTDKEIHCGHYLKADQHKATAFMFWNLFPQSYSDNRHFSGKPEIAKVWIEKTHGAGTVELLEIKKNEVCHLDETELDKWAAFYKAKFKELLKQRGIKSPWK